MIRIIALLLLLSTAPVTHAVLVTLDPNDYAIGTNLSNAQEGLTISRLQWPNGSPFDAPLSPQRSNVLATECSPYYSCLTPTSLGFGLTYMLYEFSACERGGSSCGPQVNALELLFTNPTDAVSMLLTYGSDAPIMYAYDTSGALIETCSGYGAQCGVEFEHGPYEFATTLSINREERDIARIVVGGMAGTSFAQSLTYSVPEPGSLALFGIGLVGLLLRRRPG